MKNITVKNRNFEEEVFLTDEVYDDLEKTQTKSGVTLLKLFENGRALRGFKHLVETIRGINNDAKIVFTYDDSKKEENEYHINYKDYSKITSSRFFSLYRETGLDGAKYFLNKNFPDDFEYDKSNISKAQLKKVNNIFPELIQDLSEKTKNKEAVLRRTTQFIKELRTEQKYLKSDIEELERIRKESNILLYKDKLKEFTERLVKKYPETKGKDSWQTWIYANTWMFGVQYKNPVEKQKINITGSMPDYLFPTIDGFLDILEIKLPSFEVLREDSSHKGSYMWCPETNKALGQVINYLNDIELYQLHLQKEIERVYDLKISIIKPRAFILIGKKDEWKKVKEEALRKLNYSLHGITILTYTDLYQRANEIISLY